MDKIFLIQLILLMSLLIGQTTIAQTSQTPEQQNAKKSSANGTIQDLNANGIDDAKEHLQSGKKTLATMRDQFIDANGDGICDNREQGLGFRRGKSETGKQTGKRQQGRQK